MIAPEPSTEPSREAKRPGGRFRLRGGRPDVLELEQEVEGLIEAMGDLTDGQRRYLELRWKPQVIAAKKRVAGNRVQYYGWRLPVILGAVALPPLASPTVDSVSVRWAALVVSLIVAFCAGVEGLFRFGNRWRLYRKLLDQLRAEGWAFAYSVGQAYRPAQPSKEAAFTAFVRRCEDILRRYGEEYITDVLVLGAPDRGDRRDQPPPQTQ
jgi:Protein of unknown function (DUF4231)